MFLAKVIGHIVASQKAPEFQGMKLLLIQPYINKEQKLVASGSSIVAVDSVGAGEGELVLFCQGSSARQGSGLKTLPVDAAVVGLVDTIEVLGKIVPLPPPPK